MPYPKPFLFIDVDGPINLWSRSTKKGFTPPKVRGNDEVYSWERHDVFPEGFPKGLPLVVTKNHGAELRKLDKLFTLVWATTWRHEANSIISPLVNLPTDLMVVDFPHDGSEFVWKRETNHRGTWKTKYLAKWLDDFGWFKDPADGEVKRMPWAFVDDEVNRYDRHWLKTHWDEPDDHSPVAPRLLMHVDPEFGLRTRDFTSLHTFGQANQLA